MALQEEYAYDAFISYSGSRGWAGKQPPLDRTVAERLHKSLESYRVPRSLVKDETRVPAIPPRLKKIFRDNDELHASSNLNQSLVEALERSRFLIVVCSPRARDSKWIQHEIAVFRRLGREDRILPILIEGEPDDAFPPELLKWSASRAGRERGTALNDELLTQPLAADIRASSGSRSLRLLKRERLRLLAPILGCTYDDLRQREEERFIRRVAIAAASLLVVSTILAILSILLFLARQQAARNAEAAEKNALIASEKERQAKISQQQAEQFAEEAKRNERQAVRNADLARQNERMAAHNQRQAEKNYGLALEAIAKILPLVTRPQESPQMKRVYLTNTIRELEVLREYDPDNIKSLTYLRAFYGSLASEMKKTGDPKAAMEAYAKARSLSVPEAAARLQVLNRPKAGIRRSNTLAALSFPDEYELKRLKNLLSIFEDQDAGSVRLKDVEELLEIVAEYLLHLDVDTVEGRSEARRVLQMNLNWFRLAGEREPLTKDHERLVAQINRTLRWLSIVKK